MNSTFKGREREKFRDGLGNTATLPSMTGKTLGKKIREKTMMRSPEEQVER